jgi:tRNA (guanine-N7-)-methyltransferase
VRVDEPELARVRSYARRGSRLTPTQQAAWDSHREQWLVGEERAQEGCDATEWFGREAPLVVEIGSGNGESLAEMAAARPERNVVAFEVWRPGVAATFRRLELVGATNVRVLMCDAEVALGHVFAEGEVDELWTFFPDPWRKKRHHKRRLVGPTFAQVAASRLAVGGTWRMATDWDDYATRMEQVLAEVPCLEGGRVGRWPGRPVTKFERRGLAEGRSITDLAYRRRE